ncbi:Cytoplasmic fmr1-interacting protein 1, partial [Globisporangium splendens]
MEQEESSDAAISPAADALHELSSRTYSDHRPCGGCDTAALSRLSFVGPRAQSDEIAHECALGFMFADEMKVVRQLRHKYEEGRHLVKEIYCARSCARAFPPVAPDNDGESSQAHTIKYYTAVFTVLQPQVEKIKALSDYCSQTVVMLSDNIQRITVHENTTRVIPDVLMDVLLDVMDIVLQLNQLHDTKSSLRNDFSVFKRFDQVVYLLLKHCLLHIDDEICVEPNEKFKFIRVLPNLLSVLEDSRQQTKPAGNKAAEKKAMGAAVRVLQRFPVVPMFAEMAAVPIKASSSPNGGKFDAYDETQKNLDTSFDLRVVSMKMKSTCAEYLPRLAHATLNANAISSIEHNAVLYGTILEGLQHMSEWKSSFLLFIALKYQSKQCSAADFKPIDAFSDIFIDGHNCLSSTLSFPFFIERTSGDLRMIGTLINSIYVKRSMGELNVKQSATSSLFSLKKDLDRRFYEWLADVESVDVLGKRHNLTCLLGQHIRLKLMKDLEKWMFELESSEIASVLELHSSLRVLKSVHTMLSTIVCLDDFEDMVQDVDTQVSLSEDETIHEVEGVSRLQTYASQIVLLDLCQHFAFNLQSWRFVPLPNGLQSCDLALGSAIPPFRFPRFMYRTEGCCGFFEGKFKYVLDSEELEAQVFHCLREIGNGLCFLLLLSDVMDEQVSLSAHVVLAAAASDTKSMRAGGIFARCLRRLDAMLRTTGSAKEWYASPTSRPDKMPSSSSFYHVWNALEFLSCTTRHGVSAREQFGDGVQFAGCTIIHLLRQRSMYDLWNVSQHVANVQLQEQTKVKSVLKSASSKKSLAESSLGNGGIAQSVGTLGQEMKDRAASFVANAIEMRKTSNKISHVLETSWPPACFPKESIPASSSSDYPHALCRPPVYVPPTL